MKSKKLTSLALVAAMTATLFAGCGNNDEEAKNNPTTTPGTQDGDKQQGGDQQPGGEENPGTPEGLPAMTTEEITLTYMHFDNDLVVKHVADAFMKKYPNITVKTQVFELNGYNDTLLNMINAGKVPDCYMVLGNCDFGLSHGFYGDFTYYWENDPENQNLLTSLNDYKIGYFGTDKKLATPIKYFPDVMYADLAVFEKLNIPVPDPNNWKWEDWIASVKAGTSAADQIYGFNEFHSPITYYPIANDPNCIGEFGWDGHRFNMEVWADGVNQWAELINSGYRAPYGETPENEAWTGDAKMWAAYTGKLTWQIDAFWTYINLFDTPDYRNKGMEWVPYCVPTNTAGTTFGVLDMGSISTGTKHPREAYELLKWMGWGVEGWKAKLEAYKTIVDDAGTPTFRASMPAPITLDADIWEEFTQSFFPTEKERKYQSVEDPQFGGALVTAEEDQKYGKYFDAYFKNVTRPVAFGDTQIPGFQAFIDGVYRHAVDDTDVEVLVRDQGKNAHDYAAEMAAKALEYNQQALAMAKETYALLGIELNYEVITQ